VDSGELRGAYRGRPRNLVSVPCSLAENTAMRRKRSSGRFVAFDLETAKVLPPNADLTAHMPLGIAVAACRLPSGEVRYWHGGSTRTPGPRMSRAQSASLVGELKALVTDGTSLVTWNGAAFDFLVLAHESDLWQDCAELAYGHIDIMFHFVCTQGYPVSLEAVGGTLGLRKAAGLTGAQAPKAWRQGEHRRVMDYLAGDVNMLADIYLAALRDRGLSWITRKGQTRRWQAPRMLTVAEALRLPVPDTSWMTSPVRREDLSGWIAKHVGRGPRR
jgi:hypothetical protein